MPPEPERPIEKLLRAGAKQRREQAGDAWEMHPATRRVLQGEVARQFGGKGERKPWWSGWLPGPSWARPIGALASLAVIAVAVWMSFQAIHSSKKPQALLAKNEQPKTAAAPAPSELAESDTAARSVRPAEEEGRKKISGELFDDKAPVMTRQESAAPPAKQFDLAQDKEVAVALDQLAAKTQPSSPTASPPANTPAQAGGAVGEPNNAMPLTEAQSAFAKRYGLSRDSRAAAAPPSAVPSAAPPTPDSLKLSDGAPASSLSAALSAEKQSKKDTLAYGDAIDTNLVQYGYFAATQTAFRSDRGFTQAPETKSLARNRSAALPPAARILVSFQVEQSGGQLRITDQDGSVYAGTIQTGMVAMAGTSAPQPLAPAASNGVRLQNTTGLASVSTLAQPAVSVFQVSGTNRTSNQQVIFSGTLTRGMSSLGTFSTAARAPAVDQAAATVQPSAAANNAPEPGMRVSGQALIGTGQRIQIDAVSVPGRN